MARGNGLPTLALDEITKAMQVFVAPVAGVASDQIARARALDVQVDDELGAEQAANAAA